MNKTQVQATIYLLVVLAISLHTASAERTEQDSSFNSGSISYSFSEQEYKGIPIINSVEGTVKIGGKVVKKVETYTDFGRINTDPRLNENEALEKQKSYRNKELESSRLVIYDNKLAYEFVFETEYNEKKDKPEKIVLYINANNGKKLHKQDKVIENEISGYLTGQAYPENPSQQRITVPFAYQKIKLDPGTDTYSDIEGYYEQNELPQMTSLFLGIGDNLFFPEYGGRFVVVRNQDQTPSVHTEILNLPTTFDLDWADYDQSYEMEESNTYYHVNKIHDYFTSGDPFDIHSMDYKSKATVEYGTGGCNAYSDGSNMYLKGPGNGCDSMALSSDIIYHEYTHSVVDHIYTYFPYYGESGAMNEGYADYFAATINDDPLIGEIVFPEPIRDLENDHQYPIDLMGEEHFDSLIFSAALWELRNQKGEE